MPGYFSVAARRIALTTVVAVCAPGVAGSNGDCGTPLHFYPAPRQYVAPGVPQTVELGRLLDDVTDGPWSVTVDWGDGSPAGTFQVAEAGPVERDHTFAPGAWRVRAAVGAITPRTPITLVVAGDPAPAIVTDTTAIAVDESATASVRGTYQDDLGHPLETVASFGAVTTRPLQLVEQRSYYDDPDFARFYDLNLDGTLDALWRHSDWSGIRFNDGTGDFGTRGQDFYRSGNVEPRGPLVADFDGEGSLDLLFFLPSGPEVVWLNDGAGAFIESDAGFDAPGTSRFATTDVDGDGDADIVATGTNVALSVAHVWLNQGDATFVIDPDTPFPVAVSHWVELADVDGDGWPDLLMDVDNVARIWRNDCGSFVPTSVMWPQGYWNVQLGDVDRDDDLDLLAADGWDYELWENDGTGQFTFVRPFSWTSTRPRLVDWEADGDLDVVALRNGGVAWLNDGDGNFAEETIHGFAGGHFDGGIGDVDGDLHPDLYVADDQRDVEILVRAEPVWEWDATTTDGPDESRPVEIVFTNPAGGTATTQVDLTVRNVPPQVVSPTRIGGVETGVDLDLGAFVDPGADAPWLVKLDWGDGTPVVSRTADEGGDLGVAGHDYPFADLFTCALTVTEESGTAAATRVELLIDTRPCDEGDLDGDGICDFSACGDLPDSDGDGLCDVLDRCPQRADPDAGRLRRLNAVLSGGRDVLDFALSPDERWVAYRADQDTDDVFELFVVALDGGDPLKRNGTLASGGDVLAYRFGPDSETIAYRADQEVNGRADLYVTGVLGGMPLRLNDPARGGVGPVFDFLPDGERIVYLDEDPDRFDYLSPHVVPVAGGPATVIADPENLGGDVDEVFVDPDGGWIVYNVPHRPFWSSTSPQDYSTVILDFPEEPAGIPHFISGTGRALMVNAYPFETSLIGVALDGSGDRIEVGYGYESWVERFALTPVPVDGSYHIVYDVFVRQGAGGSSILASRPFGGGPTSTLSTTAAVVGIRVSHDGRTVLYLDGHSATALHAVGLRGENPFQPGLPESTPGPIDAFAFSGDDRWALFTAEEDESGRHELYAAPLDGVGTTRRISTPLAGGIGVDEGFVPAPDGRTVVYLGDQDVAGERELFAVAVEGGAQRKLNLAVPDGSSVPSDFVVTADSRRVLFRAPHSANGSVNLYSAALEVDSDDDGHFDSCDNCDRSANPDQADANANGVGDACDPCGTEPDVDADGLCDADDNCVGVSSPDSTDDDGDGVGNVCDACPFDPRYSTAGFDVLQVFGAADGDAALANPRDLITDAAGRIWIADTAHHRIAVFEENGGLAFAFGTAGSGNGQLRAPKALDWAPTGELYVLDSFNDRVQVFDTGGNYLDQFGESGAAPGQLRNPGGLAVAGDGTVWIVDTGNDRVQAFAADGTFLLAFGATGGGPGSFRAPVGIALGPDGNVWVTDADNGRVQVFDTAGGYLRSFGHDADPATALELPTDVAFIDGLVLVTEPFRQRVQVRDRTGAPLAALPLPVEGRAEGVDVDDAGRIRIVSRAADGRGFVTTALAPADPDGDGAPTCLDACPFDAADDSDGDGACADMDNCRTVSNGAQADADDDGAGDACDCAPDTAGAFALPTAVHALVFVDPATLVWADASGQSGPDVDYRVLLGAGGEWPVGGGTAESCTTTAASPTLVDPAIPAPGAATYYLVLGRNVCGNGPFGPATDGPRATSTCAD